MPDLPLGTGVHCRRINFQGMMSAESTVTSEIMLRYKPELGLIAGVAGIRRRRLRGRSRWPSVPLLPRPAGGPSLSSACSTRLESGRPDADGNYPGAHVSDLTLAYSPDNLIGKSHSDLPQPRDAAECPPFRYSGVERAYLDAHADELGVGGLEMVDWDVSGGELLRGEGMGPGRSRGSVGDGGGLIRAPPRSWWLNGATTSRLDVTLVDQRHY